MRKNNFYYIEIKGNVETAAEEIWYTTFASYRSEKGTTVIKCAPNMYNMTGILRREYKHLGEIVDIQFINGNK